MREEIFLGIDHTAQVVIKVPDKAEGHGPYALRINFIRVWLHLTTLTFSASNNNNIRMALTATVPTRWDVGKTVRTFGTTVISANVPLTEGNLVALYEWRWLTNAATEPIWSAEAVYDATPVLLACSGLNVETLISNTTAWTAKLVVDYDIVEVSPEAWQELLPG